MTNKDGGLETGPEFEEIEQIYTCKDIQNVVPTEGLAVPESGRLVGIVGSKRRLFPRTNVSSSQKISKVRFPEKDLSVSRPSIWAKHGTKSFYKGVSSSRRVLALSRSVRISVLRRLSYRVKVKNYARRFSETVARSSLRRRVSDQCQEIPVKPITGVGVSGNDSQYRSCKVYSAIAEGRDVAPMCLPVHESGSVQASKTVSPIIRIDVSGQSHGAFRPPLHETFPDIFAFSMESSLSKVVTSSHGASPLASPRPVVEGSTKSHAGAIMEKVRSSSNPYHRRLRVSLGRAYERFYSPRALDKNPTPITHQSFGDVGSTVLTSDVSQVCRKPQCLSPHGQYVSLPLHQQVRRNEIAGTVQSGMALVSVVHRASGRYHGSSSARDFECSGRQPVETFIPTIGVDSGSDSSRSDLPPLVHPRPRSFRHSRKQKSSSILHISSTSSSVLGGCSDYQLDGSLPVCISASCFNSQGPSASAGRRTSDDIDSSVVVEKGMVSAVAGPSHRLSQTPATVSRASDPESGQTSALQRSTNELGGVADQRRSLVDGGVSARAAATILAATSDNTNKQYAYSWRHYADWCAEKEVDPYHATVQVIVNYFSDCFDQGLSYNTVKARQTAITSRHEVYGGMRTGQKSLSNQPLVRRLFGGAKRKFPPVVDRVPAWDLPTVLQALQGAPFEPLEKLDLPTLTHKTVFLLAVASAKRLGELQAIDVSPQFSIITPDRVVLRTNDKFLPKVPSVRNIQQALEFVPLGESSPNPAGTLRANCVCRALVAYMKATRHIRQGNQLFVTFKKSDQGRPASKTTIASWLKAVISQAYLIQGKTLEKVARAHGVRKSSVTWAELGSVSVTDICRQACWQSSSTFVKHYKLTIPRTVSERHAETVLGSVNFAE